MLKTPNHILAHTHIYYRVKLVQRYTVIRSLMTHLFSLSCINYIHNHTHSLIQYTKSSCTDSAAHLDHLEMI